MVPHIARALPASLILVIPLLLSALPASAQSQANMRRGFQIAGYALSLAPETQETASKRWERSYLAQIRFTTDRASGRGRSAAPAAVPSVTATSPAPYARRIALPPNRDTDGVAEAIAQVVALESALWKRGQLREPIANNRLARLPKCETKTDPEIIIVRAASDQEQPQQSLPLPLYEAPVQQDLKESC